MRVLVRNALVQRSSTECGVSECDCEAPIMKRSWPTRDSCAGEERGGGVASWKVLTLRDVETLANTLNGFKGTVTEQNRCHGEVKLLWCTKEGKLVGGIPYTMKNSDFFFLVR